jgi:hypothetical protein
MAFGRTGLALLFVALLFVLCHVYIEVNGSKATKLTEHDIRGIMAATNNVVVGPIPKKDAALPDEKMLAKDPDFLTLKELYTSGNLKKDPRMKPADLVVEKSHLEVCTSCADNSEAFGSKIGAITEKQLLVDDYIVHASANLVRRIEPPCQNMVVIAHTKKASGPMKDVGGFYGDAHFDGSKFHMWLRKEPDWLRKEPDEVYGWDNVYGSAYYQHITSSDGLHWGTTNPSDIRFQISEPLHIPFSTNALCVVLDKGEHLYRAKYKCSGLWWQKPGATDCFGHSDDFIHWIPDDFPVQCTPGTDGIVSSGTEDLKWAIRSQNETSLAFGQGANRAFSASSLAVEANMKFVLHGSDIPFYTTAISASWHTTDNIFLAGKWASCCDQNYIAVICH